MDLGSSLAVENVQELEDIPQRYIRSETELQVEESSTDECFGVPVIDMGKLASCPNEMKRLHQACEEWGFFQADKVIGLSPHSDGDGLTLLVQLNAVDGLQIKHNNNWVPVKPVSDRIVVNIGDLLEIISNGKYKSVEHRAMVNYDKERLSIAAFHSPAIKSMIGPLPDLVNNAPNYKTVKLEEYYKLYMKSKLEGKSTLSQMKMNAMDE